LTLRLFQGAGRDDGGLAESIGSVVSFFFYLLMLIDVQCRSVDRLIFTHQV
jgi:hypothetical protein